MIHDRGEQCRLGWGRSQIQAEHRCILNQGHTGDHVCGCGAITPVQSLHGQIVHGPGCVPGSGCIHEAEVTGCHYKES